MADHIRPELEAVHSDPQHLPRDGYAPTLEGIQQAHLVLTTLSTAHVGRHFNARNAIHGFFRETRGALRQRARHRWIARLQRHPVGTFTQIGMHTSITIAQILIGNAVLAVVFVREARITILVSAQRDRIGEHVLVDLLSEMDGTTTITKADIKEMLPDITNTQLDMLFQACKDNMKFKLKQEIDRATFMKVAAGIKLNIDQVNEQILQAIKQQVDAKDVDEAKEEKGAEVAEEPESKEGRSRMLGSSKPFPGMPATPGGFCPPLLAPEDASNEVPDATGRPEWLRALDHSMDLQDAWMASLQVQLQELQWKWKMTQRAGGDASRLATKEALQEIARHEDASFEDASQEYNKCGSLMSRGGATIL